jgi:predicted phage terminase large subunit-like protein
MIAGLVNGAEVVFRSADDPDRTMRGPNLSGAWLDEASLMDRLAVDLTMAALREGGDQGWLTATFTPQGRQHWTHDFFNTGRPNTAMFHARTGDNIFNPPGFEAQLRQQYTSAFAEQELAGKFVELCGTVARREWFKVVDAAPACTRKVRAWDFAATPEDGQGRGDYTVGALLGQTANGWCILDLVRSRVAGGQVMALVKQTAKMDGTGVQVGLEQEPGSSGKVAVSFMVKELAGFPVKPIVPSRDKLTRALPLLAQAEAGNVAMLRANWNAAFLDELAAFPNGEHDDQMDAAAHAFNLLHQPAFVGISLPPD